MKNKEKKSVSLGVRILAGIMILFMLVGIAATTILLLL